MSLGAKTHRDDALNPERRRGRVYRAVNRPRAGASKLGRGRRRGGDIFDHRFDAGIERF
jgi:hypothetical protein